VAGPTIEAIEFRGATGIPQVAPNDLAGVIEREQLPAPHELRTANLLGSAVLGRLAVNEKDSIGSVPAEGWRGATE